MHSLTVLEVLTGWRSELRDSMACFWCGLSPWAAGDRLAVGSHDLFPGRGGEACRESRKLSV